MVGSTASLLPNITLQLKRGGCVHTPRPMPATLPPLPALLLPHPTQCGRCSNHSSTPRGQSCQAKHSGALEKGVSPLVQWGLPRPRLLGWVCPEVSTLHQLQTAMHKNQSNSSLPLPSPLPPPPAPSCPSPFTSQNCSCSSSVSAGNTNPSSNRST